MDENETKRLIATLIQVVDRANARITALEQLIIAEAEAMAGFTARLDDHDNRAASLAQRLETRIAAIEQRLATLEEPQGDPDDVRDALAALDELSAYWASRRMEGRLPGLWKLDNFPPTEGNE